MSVSSSRKKQSNRFDSIYLNKQLLTIKNKQLFIDNEPITGLGDGDNIFDSINLNNHSLTIKNKQLFIDNEPITGLGDGDNIFDSINLNNHSLTIKNKQLFIENEPINISGNINIKESIHNVSDIEKHYFLHGKKNENTDEINYFNNTMYIQEGILKVNGSIEMISDKNLKENIKDLPKSLNKIDNIHAYNYNLKNCKRNDIGLMAQEVEKEYPELVSTNDLGIKSVNYMQFTAVLLKCVQELKEEINILKKKI